MKTRLGFSLVETVVALFILSVVVVGMLYVVTSLDHLQEKGGLQEDELAQVAALLKNPTNGDGRLGEDFFWQRRVAVVDKKRGLYHIELAVQRDNGATWSFETVLKGVNDDNS